MHHSFLKMSVENIAYSNRIFLVSPISKNVLVNEQIENWCLWEQTIRTIITYKVIKDNINISESTYCIVLRFGRIGHEDRSNIMQLNQVPINLI